jgi:hypothetical protein
VAVDVFEDFTLFERSAVQVDVLRLIFKPAWSDIPQPPEVLACLRADPSALGHAGRLAPRLTPRPLMTSPAASSPRAIKRVAHRSPAKSSSISWAYFFWPATRPPASALTWAFYILADQPHWLARLREEIAAVVGDAPMSFEHTLTIAADQGVFQRDIAVVSTDYLHAAGGTARGHSRWPASAQGALVMIAPWTLQRTQ